ncbi:group II intron reverse transcriptase/maturase [Paenibacillus sp. FSL H8-0548]|uniref:group II intron reverse transcriptase/maturase n=1 Tax=Paenibacillus sp. FSL H8-0548 TaxID=1920422 RepID=UPI00096FBF3B|nr:group II intron reverse transcriptase/maturase [Paenibacillus sp. FSL H8-0548]OMF38859.1 group II intron reverse transcriptase/maturase [Paenibacillus sp. FSL H8-0548]
MNQELKLKWHSIYGQILFERKLHAAWLQVKENKGAGGIDGETLESYEKKLDENLSELLQKLKNKAYVPSPVRRRYIPKKNGKMRPLGIPNIEDRIVQQAIVNVLQPKCEESIFHRWSCGYRPNYGAKRVAQIILWNIETDHNFIYDCDIRGFFDNIPHKKLIGILTKYIADGTVLDMIWKWLKAGYMEEGRYHEVDAGTPQGGVISPLLANLYLNELDWKLEEHGIRFVRYADDFLLFAKTEEEIRKAAEVTRETLGELGLEVAMEKTKTVNFKEDDFDFLGFTFEHWRERKKDGKPYFIAKPKDATWKDFKQKVKAKTRKTLTLNKKAWLERVNPIIRGKVNYFLNLYKAVEENKRYGQESRCFFNACRNQLFDMDGYVRQRLRVAMTHSHPSQRKGHAMKTKWNNEFFARIGLVSAFWAYYNAQYGYTLENYIDYMKNRQKAKHAQKVQKAKERGQEYYTPDRVRKMQYAQRLATY